jgi:hypothetical protein
MAGCSGVGVGEEFPEKAALGILVPISEKTERDSERGAEEAIATSETV